MTAEDRWQSHSGETELISGAEAGGGDGERGAVPVHTSSLKPLAESGTSTFFQNEKTLLKWQHTSEGQQVTRCEGSHGRYYPVAFWEILAFAAFWILAFRENVLIQ